MAEIEYLAQLAGCQAQGRVFVQVVAGRWVAMPLDEVWANVASQLQAVKEAKPNVGERPLDVVFAELCYLQVTGGSVDVLVRFDDTRPAAHEPDHDAILRLYLGQDRRRTWHLPKNVATFETLVDPAAPLKDPTRSLFAHLAMRQISELTRAAAGTALGSGERRAIFGPLLQLVRHRLPGLVDEAGCAQLEAVIEDLIDRAA